MSNINFKINIQNTYSDITDTQLNMAIKYKDKFQLTIENLKCINPNCNQMKKWGNNINGFRYTCSNICKQKMKKEITIFQTENREKTNLKKYGYKNQFSNPNLKNYKEQKYFEEYGFKHCMQNPEVLKKREKNYFEKNGVTHQAKNKKLLEIKKQKYFESYGVSHFAQIHIQNYKHWDDKEFWVMTFIDDTKRFNLTKAMNYFNYTQTIIHKQLKKLGIEYTKISGTSLKEQDIVNYLQNYYDLTIIQNDRQLIKPHELDIYLPEIQLAIEYNGSYWHSYHPVAYTCDKQADLEFMMYRHQQKALACLEQGIRLLHLYEDQTIEQQYELIDKFLINEYDPEATAFSLDNGCYPNNIEAEILEPEARIVLENRTIYNAGQIKIARKL